MIFVHQGLFQYPDYRPALGEAVRAGDTVIVHTAPNGDALPEIVRARATADSAADSAELHVEAEDEDERGGRREYAVGKGQAALLRSTRLIENDAQLAMVLGHEISHVIHDHVLENTEHSAVAMGAQLVRAAGWAWLRGAWPCHCWRMPLPLLPPRLSSERLPPNWLSQHRMHSPAWRCG
jgi:hypothetical protein